jgi:hypothetical protein
MSRSIVRVLWWFSRMLLLLLFVFAVHLVPVRLWLHCRVRVADNVPSAEAVPDKDREKAKHLFADFR